MATLFKVVDVFSVRLALPQPMISARSLSYSVGSILGSVGKQTGFMSLKIKQQRRITLAFVPALVFTFFREMNPNLIFILA